jgi:hypothetical protein
MSLFSVLFKWRRYFLEKTQFCPPFVVKVPMCVITYNSADKIIGRLLPYNTKRVVKNILRQLSRTGPPPSLLRERGGGLKFQVPFVLSGGGVAGGLVEISDWFREKTITARLLFSPPLCLSEDGALQKHSGLQHQNSLSVLKGTVS